MCVVVFHEFYRYTNFFLKKKKKFLLTASCTNWRTKRFRKHLEGFVSVKVTWWQSCRSLRESLSASSPLYSPRAALSSCLRIRLVSAWFCYHVVTGGNGGHTQTTQTRNFLLQTSDVDPDPLYDGRPPGSGRRMRSAKNLIKKQI